MKETNECIPAVRILDAGATEKGEWRRGGKVEVEVERLKGRSITPLKMKMAAVAPQGDPVTQHLQIERFPFSKPWRLFCMLPLTRNSSLNA